MAAERYNVAYNLLGLAPNTPVDFDPGKELHPPILSMLEIHGGKVKRERERERDILQVFFNYHNIIVLNFP